MGNMGIIIIVMLHLYMVAIVFECQVSIFYSPEITPQFSFGKQYLFYWI